MSHANLLPSTADVGRRPAPWLGRAYRVLVTCSVAAVVLWGVPRAGADPEPAEWFGSPITGTTYRVEFEASTRTKRLVAPDGGSFASIAAILAAENEALTPLERLMDAELREVSGDPARADELVDVTLIFRRQPLHDAGVVARARANPGLQEELARQHRILDRIAPLRTQPSGPPSVAAAMQDEARLLTDEEKATLRTVRDRVRSILATMRREVMAAARVEVERDQDALLAYVRDLPEALDLGGTVTLNARSARLPAGALREIAKRFPEVMRIERVTLGVGCLDTAVPTVRAGSTWTAGYTGSSSTQIAVIDGGIDSSHPALSGVVTAAATYHTTASTVTGTYGDNASSTDDLQGHGTNVAGMLCSSDTTYTGIAYGALILNAKAAFLNSTTGACSMWFSDGRLAADWAINQGATLLTLNFGGPGANDGTDEMALFFDAAASSLAIPGTLAAKNDGPSASTVGYPGGAFNVLTVGNFDDAGTTTASDDSIYNTSGRGPTTDGRQKPDICGPGVNITTTAYDWEGTNSDFVSISPGTSTGTSAVGPIVAGGVALLQDYSAAAYPEGLKALLLTTALNTSPYGGPDDTWGHGILDCAAAYTNRGSVYEGQLTSTGPRFVLLRGGSLGSGGRTTLVWNRQVRGSPTRHRSAQR